LTTISRQDGRCTPENTTVALVGKILDDNPALVRELAHRHTFNRKRLMTRLGPHLDGIETASDWLLDHVRFAARPTLDTAVVRDVYQAASGNRIEILDFVLAAFLAGYPVFCRRGPVVPPRKKPATYFDFGFGFAT
jgi:hypothetical protein